MFKLFSFVMMQKSVVEKYSDLFSKFYNSFIEILTDIFTKLEVEHPELEARSLSAVIDGLQFHMVYVGNEIDIVKMVEHLKNTYIYRR